MKDKTFVPFWKDNELTRPQRNAKLVETCRNVFGTEEGKVALNMLLDDLFVFRDAKTERDNYLNEYGKFFIRERLGVRDTKALTDFIAETAVSGGGK